MKIVKKIARRILRQELQTKREEIEYQINLRDKNYRELEKKWIRLYNENKKILISQDMLKAIVEILPDANAIGRNEIYPADFVNKDFAFLEKVNNEYLTHSLKFVRFDPSENRNVIGGVTIRISDYDIDVHIPLRRENINYVIFGMNSTIDTFFWDFYKSGIRMISTEAWKVITEFRVAQTNVLNDLKKEGLL